MRTQRRRPRCYKRSHHPHADEWLLGSAVETANENRPVIGAPKRELLVTKGVRKIATAKAAALAWIRSPPRRPMRQQNSLVRRHAEGSREANWRRPNCRSRSLGMRRRHANYCASNQRPVPSPSPICAKALDHHSGAARAAKRHPKAIVPGRRPGLGCAGTHRDRKRVEVVWFQGLSETSMTRRRHSKIVACEGTHNFCGIEPIFCLGR